MLNGRAQTLRRVRRLRREVTLSEVLVWPQLRLRPHALKFRRQHPAGPYALDFYCADAGLAIEIDGAGHDARVADDTRRDRYFRKLGIETLRIPARDVLDDLDQAVEIIVGATIQRGR